MSNVTDAPPSPQLSETPDTHGAYPRLSDDQIATLEVGGTRRDVHTGEVSELSRSSAKATPGS